MGDESGVDLSYDVLYFDEIADNDEFLMEILGQEDIVFAELESKPTELSGSPTLKSSHINTRTQLKQMRYREQALQEERNNQDQRQQHSESVPIKTEFPSNLLVSKENLQTLQVKTLLENPIKGFIQEKVKRQCKELLGTEQISVDNAISSCPSNAGLHPTGRSPDGYIHSPNSEMSEAEADLGDILSIISSDNIKVEVDDESWTGISQVPGDRLKKDSHNKVEKARRKKIDAGINRQAQIVKGNIFNKDYWGGDRECKGSTVHAMINYTSDLLKAFKTTEETKKRNEDLEKEIRELRYKNLELERRLQQSSVPNFSTDIFLNPNTFSSSAPLHETEDHSSNLLHSADPMLGQPMEL